jgi:hypothetical protein
MIKFYVKKKNIIPTDFSAQNDLCFATGPDSITK